MLTPQSKTPPKELVIILDHEKQGIAKVEVKSETPETDALLEKLRNTLKGLTKHEVLEKIAEFESAYVDHARSLEQRLNEALAKVSTLENQWKEYCTAYDEMLAKWKDEKSYIAARCGKPWDNGVGLEPWCAADDLMKEKNSIKQERDSLLAQIAVKDLAIQWAIDAGAERIDNCLKNALTNSPAAAKELMKELHELRSFKAGSLKSMARAVKPTTDW